MSRGNPSGPGGAAPDALKEPVSGGSAGREPEQKSKWTQDAARPPIEKALCSSCPPADSASPGVAEVDGFGLGLLVSEWSDTRAAGDLFGLEFVEIIYLS